MDFHLVAWLALVDAQGRVLLGRRANVRYGAGLWSLPGGHVERGERLAEAAAREAHEEIGVTVPAGVLTSLGVCRYDVGRAAGADYFFVAREWSGTPAPVSETSEVAWFAPGDLPPDVLPWLPGVLDAHLRRGVRVSELMDDHGALNELG